MVYLSICFICNFFISFINILQYFDYRSFAALSRFIHRFHRHFIPFAVMKNGIVSLISIYNLSLIMYRNTRDFCVLILYPTSLPNSSMSSSNFLGEGNGTPLQYSCLENPMDGGAWKAEVHEVAEGRTRLSDFNFTFHFHAWRRKWQPTPVFLPGESQGRGSLVGCCLWGRT